jgi:superfamily II DNA or RNA helicase
MEDPEAMHAHIELRSYQIEGINRIRAAYQSGRRAPLFVLPTGGGKTYTFAAITSIMQKRGKRVTILVHRDQLLTQCHDALNSLGIDHGLIMAGRTPLDRQIQVASVYTLTRRVEDLPAPDLYIIDEAHHVRARTWANIIETHNRSRLLGVTATPVRTDGSGLGVQSGGYFDQMILGPSMAELRELGYLSPYDYYQPPAGVDLSNVRTSAGDYNKRELDHAMNKSTITGCAVQHYRKICDGAPAIAFCVSTDHADAVARDFAASGYRAMALHSKMKTDPKVAIRALGEGRLDVLTSCDIISEGTDVPIVSAAILLRPTHSLGLFLQQVGRVLRPQPGKTATILDHVGNVARHGLPDQPRQWELDSQKKRTKKGQIEDKAPPVRQCEHCFHCHRPQPTCPRCGFVYKGGREIETVDGTLRKIDRGEIERAQRQRKRQRAMEQGRAQTLEDLIAIGQKNGRGRKWAYIVWNARKKKKEKTLQQQNRQQRIEL